MSSAVVFLLFCDFGYEGKIFSLVVVVETTLIHSKVHVGLVVFLAVNNKHFFEAVISYSILLYQVLEGKDVSASGIVKSHILDVSCYHCLVIYDYFPSVSTESHLLLCLVDPLHHILIA